MADVSTGTLMVSGADEYGDIVLRADIGADVTDSGRVTVPAIVSATAAGMSGQVDIRTEGGELRLEDGRSSASLPALDAVIADTPRSVTEGCVASAAQLATALRECARWTANPTWGGVIGGVDIHTDADRLLIAATNRYVLRQDAISIEGAHLRALIPPPLRRLGQPVGGISG